MTFCARGGGEGEPMSLSGGEVRTESVRTSAGVASGSSQACGAAWASTHRICAYFVVPMSLKLSMC